MQYSVLYFPLHQTGTTLLSHVNDAVICVHNPSEALYSFNPLWAAECINVLCLWSSLCMNASYRPTPHRVGMMLEYIPGEFLASAAFMHQDIKGHDVLKHYATLRGLGINRNEY